MTCIGDGIGTDKVQLFYMLYSRYLEKIFNNGKKPESMRKYCTSHNRQNNQKYWYM